MLDFMVIALPRSGTTWAAHWLTSDRAFCVHDPLWLVHYSDLDRAVQDQANGRLAGISCTGIWRWPEWVASHPARKLVLHRDIAEVADSLAAASLPPLPPTAAAGLASIPGKHVEWTDLFDPRKAAALWDWLTAGLPFDGQRHADLVQLEIQPRFDAVRRDVALNRRLAQELGAARLNQDAPLEIILSGK